MTFELWRRRAPCGRSSASIEEAQCRRDCRVYDYKDSIRVTVQSDVYPSLGNGSFKPSLRLQHDRMHQCQEHSLAGLFVFIWQRSRIGQTQLLHCFNKFSGQHEQWCYFLKSARMTVTCAEFVFIYVFVFFGMESLMVRSIESQPFNLQRMVQAILGLRLP